MQWHLCSNMFLNPMMNFIFMKNYYFLCFMSTKIHNWIILTLFQKKTNFWVLQNPKEQRTTTPTLALLLLIQVVWMIKLKVEHVKIITHKLYGSSYILIITWKLYSSSYALLYKWYESMTMEELFIVLFIPKLLFLLRRQALQVALASLSNTTKANN